MIKEIGHECGKILQKSRASFQTGKKVLAILLAAAVLSGPFPLLGISASAAEAPNDSGPHRYDSGFHMAMYNNSETKPYDFGFHVTMYDYSARVELPYIDGAEEYTVYMSTESGLTDFSGVSCVFESDAFQPCFYVRPHQEDMLDASKRIVLNENTAYYFYLTTGEGTAVKASVCARTRPLEDCIWTSVGNYDTSWYDSSENTFTINTAAQLAGLAVLVDGLNGVSPVDFTDKTVYLGSSLNLSSRLWTPIGTSEHNFNGAFDGENHVITGLNFPDHDFGDSIKVCMGLFGAISSSSTIKNVGVAHSLVYGMDDIGAIVGMSHGTVSNCYNTGTVIGSSMVGGVVGLSDGSIDHCYNTGDVIGDEDPGKDGSHVGGITGNTSGPVEWSYNTGYVKGLQYVGGVAGSADGQTNDDFIIGCYNMGAVNGDGNWIGGIVGQASNTIKQNYNTGAVSGASEVGGIAGEQYENAFFTNTFADCYNTGAVTGAEKVGGLVGYKSEGNSEQNSYSIGSVNNTESNFYWGDDVTATPIPFTDASALLDKINADGSFCAAPTQYADGGVFSEEHPVNGGYPVLKAFGYTGDDTDDIAGEFAEDSDGAYLVSNAYQLDLIRQGTDGDQFRLACPVDVSPAQYGLENNADGSWKAIENDSDGSFCAEFDGNGHTVSGLYIDAGDSDDQGLFGIADEDLGKVYNVGVTDSFVKGGYEVGGVMASGSPVGCFNTGVVVGEERVGGVSGSCRSADGCFNVGVVVGEERVGGVVGSSNADISSCCNIGTVIGLEADSDSQSVGGIVGYGNSSSSVSSSYNMGNVSGLCAVGGIAGVCRKISGCYNTGAVTAAGSEVGGILGEGDNRSVSRVILGEEQDAGVYYCYNLGPVAGQSNVGGIVGTFLDDGSSVSNCYYAGYLGGVGQDGTAEAKDDGTVPFLSLTRQLNTGDRAQIEEIATEQLNPEFKEIFGITSISYPEYQSTNTNVLTVDGKTVTAVKGGRAVVTGGDGADFIADIVISQNALNLNNTEAGFSNAGTAMVAGRVRLPVEVVGQAANGVDSYSLRTEGGKIYDGTIDDEGHTISVTVPAGTDVTDLIAAFTTSAETVKVGGVEQENGVTSNDFTDPVVYTFAAADGSSEEFTVTVTVGKKSGGEDHNNHNHTSAPSPEVPHTQTRVDAGGNQAVVATVADSVSQHGGTATIRANVPTITKDTTGPDAALDLYQPSAVTIRLPADSITQQLNGSQNVDLILTLPSEAANNTLPNGLVNVVVDQAILQAAKDHLVDFTMNIVDADTQQAVSTWTFKGADLAKSNRTITDLNISMKIRTTVQVPEISQFDPGQKGLVIQFDPEEALPSEASIELSVQNYGIKPGQTLYLYQYDSSLQKLVPMGQQFTVDAFGNVSMQTDQCLEYVLLPEELRTITLDTREYTMNVGDSYIIGVKLQNAPGTIMKTYSSTKGVASATVLKNGNVEAVGLKPGQTYIMMDVYDTENHFLTHASIRLTVKKGLEKPFGNSWSQFGMF